MELYFKELSWSFDFSSTHQRIKDLSANQVRHGNNIHSEFHSVPLTAFKSEYPFSAIENAANAHGFSIANVLYRKQTGYSFSTIHTDSFNLATESRATVPFSLNIPLENTTGAITRWYDFSNNPELKDEETRVPILNYKKFNSPTSSHVSEFLKYCIANYTMKAPVIINTAIPHNVDARGLTGDRAILSIWFIHTATGKLATWDQSKFLEDITID